MNNSRRSHLPQHLRWLRFAVRGTCAVLLGAAPAATAQDVISTGGGTPPAPAQSGMTGPSDSSGTTAPDVTGRPVFEWGPVNLRPSITYRYTYGDGIQSAPGLQQKTGIHSFAPDFAFTLGQHWTFNYMPTWQIYSNAIFKDNVSQSAALAGSTTYQSWTVQFGQTFNSSSPVLVETAQQTKQKTADTTFGVTYAVGQRVSIELTGAQNLRFVDNSSPGLTDTREWSTTDWFRYRLGPALRLSAGVAAGYVSIQRSPDMDYQRLLGEIEWTVTDKTSLNLQVGWEHRSFNSPLASDMNNPTLDLSLRYHPFPETTLTLTGSESVGASYFTREVVEGRGWSARLDQRLLGHLNFSTGYSRRDSKYSSTVTGGTTGRDDKYSTFDVRLSTVLRVRTTLAVFYQNADNSTNAAGYGFSSNQWGLEAGYRF